MKRTLVILVVISLLALTTLSTVGSAAYLQQKGKSPVIRQTLAGTHYGDFLLWPQGGNGPFPIEGAKGGITVNTNTGAYVLTARGLPANADCRLMLYIFGNTFDIWSIGQGHTNSAGSVSIHGSSSYLVSLDPGTSYDVSLNVS